MGFEPTRETTTTHDATRGGLAQRQGRVTSSRCWLCFLPRVAVAVVMVMAVPHLQPRAQHLLQHSLQHHKTRHLHP
jgi:hypothetical protein